MVLQPKQLVPQTLASFRLARRTRGADTLVSLSTRNKALAIMFARETDIELSVDQRFTLKETFIYLKVTLPAQQTGDQFKVSQTQMTLIKTKEITQ